MQGAEVTLDTVLELKVLAALAAAGMAFKETQLPLGRDNPIQVAEELVVKVQEPLVQAAPVSLSSAT
tara:strand:- start:146 stop:346 length:201 start_codon:yes stop_codon:yes gene_type:complete